MRLPPPPRGQTYESINEFRPAWANPTPNVDPRVWYPILVSHGLDELALQQLYLLSQHSPWGYAEANTIIEGLLDDHVGVARPKFWTHKAITTARTRLRESRVPDFPDSVWIAEYRRTEGKDMKP